MLSKILWGASGLLVVGWIVGVVFKIAEDAIHLLLVIAAFFGVVNVALRFRRGPATD
jgi:hypothetical protein